MKKVRCLIVDDEELVLQRLTLFFDSLSAGGSPYILVGQACSGQKGMELAAALEPDIVITDIRMPGMDGITMIERMKESMSGTEFIILTAYSDFDYAKRAIHINVSDYIVKVPLNEDDLLMALDKASANLRNTKNKEEQLRKLDMTILQNRHRVFKQFFRELLRGEIRPERAAEIVASYDMKLLQGSYCCMVIEMNRFADFVNRYPIADQGILKYGIVNVIEETHQAYGESFACEIDRHRFIAFLGWPNVRSMNETEQKYWEIGQTVIRNIRTYLKQSVSIGFSSPRKGWEEIVSAYRQALEACEEHYYRGPESVVTSNRPWKSGEGDARQPRELLQKLLQSLRRESDEAERLKAGFRSFHEFAMKEKLPRQMLTGLLKEFMIAARSRIPQWKQELAEADEEALSYMTLAEQLEFLEGYIAECLDVKGIPGRPDIAKAIEYIERNLTERLSLQMIAEQANLAPAYFSSLFKKEMKESVVDYVNRKKIEASIEILNQNHYTNQEICDKIGIINEAYFCTLFKQKTGCTPGQYRKKMKQLSNPKG